MSASGAKSKLRGRTILRFPAFSVCYLAIIQTVNMIMTMAMNYSSTRSRISFCDVLPGPPRLMLMRPRRSTTATAPMAIMTATCDMKSAVTGQPSFIGYDDITREIEQ